MARPITAYGSISASCSPSALCSPRSPQRCTDAWAIDEWLVSCPQPLAVHAFVNVGDEFAIAVEQQRRLALAGAYHFLARLAPARMVDLRIDVGPEAVFGRLQRFPHALRALVGKGKAHDRLDRLEAVFPRHRQPQRRTML